MDAMRFSLLLLLLRFTCCLDSEETLVKTIGKESDFTPICTNETSNIIMMIVCWIRTERNNREQCSLRYRDGGDFVHECGSRFSLKTRNQTVFLHLTSLTAADSGNYSCQCAKLDGTHFLHLRIIVNEDTNPDDNSSDEVWSQSGVILLSAAVLLVIKVSVILVFIHRRRPHRCLRSKTFESSVHGSAAAIDDDNLNELYVNLQRPSRDLYQTVSSGHRQHAANRNSANKKETGDLENLERNRNIYEN
uniref:Immunoglobulin V-set domain-containing protein n=1 Tax=Poecilia formosa TaxID=48698 RepID=A0A096LZV8_POEFO